VSRPPHRPPASERPAGHDHVLAGLFRDLLDTGYASGPDQAAAGRSPSRGAPARSWQAIGLVAVLLLGLLLAVAYQQVVAEQPTRAQVRADLEAQIRDRQVDNQQLQEQAERLREEVAELRDQQLDDPAAVRQLRQLEAATGLRRVHGDGVVVRVADGPAAVDPVSGDPVIDPQARILYRDLQQLTNALWAAGAEAVAVNGHRLTVTSTIRSASGAILIDRQPVAGPYEVVAVGPADLQQRFGASQAAQLMQVLGAEYGIEYEVRAQADLTLPAAVEPQLHHATPAQAR
jgi:uncharacterized protein YlxW (UPF0749 family)